MGLGFGEESWREGIVGFCEVLWVVGFCGFFGFGLEEREGEAEVEEERERWRWWWIFSCGGLCIQGEVVFLIFWFAWLYSWGIIWISFTMILFCLVKQ